MDTTNTTNAVRLVFETTLTFAGTPDEVFPLLCPVREYDWIPDWSCTMVHTTSGVAELGCVFTRERGETWITTRYEPPTRIDYTIVAPGRAVRTLAFELTASGPTTTAILRSTATALSPEGAADVLGWTAADQQKMWTLREAQVNHFLRTGAALPLNTGTGTETNTETTPA
jgi:hypothetical protein